MPRDLGIVFRAVAEPSNEVLITLPTSVAPSSFLEDLFDFIAIIIVREAVVMHYGRLGIAASVRVLYNSGFKLYNGHDVMYLLVRRELYIVC